MSNQTKQIGGFPTSEDPLLEAALRKLEEHANVFVALPNYNPLLITQVPSKTFFDRIGFVVVREAGLYSVEDPLTHIDIGSIPRQASLDGNPFFTDFNVNARYTFAPGDSLASRQYERKHGVLSFHTTPGDQSDINNTYVALSDNFRNFERCISKLLTRHNAVSIS